MTFSRPPGESYDLSTVSSVSVVAQRPVGGAVTWTPGILSATAAELVCRHVFAADGSDVPNVGTYELSASFSFPGGITRRARSIRLVVERR